MKQCCPHQNYHMCFVEAFKNRKLAVTTKDIPVTFVDDFQERSRKIHTVIPKGTMVYYTLTICSGTKILVCYPYGKTYGQCVINHSDIDLVENIRISQKLDSVFLKIMKDWLTTLESTTSIYFNSERFDCNKNAYQPIIDYLEGVVQ